MCPKIVKESAAGKSVDGIPPKGLTQGQQLKEAVSETHMTTEQKHRVHVSMWIAAAPEKAFSAFIEPTWLTRFWLSNASAPLQLGIPVKWSFMVAGAEDMVTATRLDAPRALAWKWSDGSAVEIAFEAVDGGTAVTIVHSGFSGSEQEQMAAALDGTEGFTIVVCDLKALLETGSSASLTRAKAKLIELRSGK